MSEQGSLRQRKTSALSHSQQNEIAFPGVRPRPSPVPRPTSHASVISTNYSETDQSEILSPTPRRHYLLQQQSSQWLSSPISPPTSRPSSPLNPNAPRHRKHKPSLSFSSLAEQHVKGRREGKVDGVNGSAARRWVRWMHKSGFKDWVLPAQILAAIWVKWAVGLGSYSGEDTPPMYGDYEAQRHWMEITYHLPFRQWYKYDLQYWGLDYPPLTAYVSWLCGYIANRINPVWVALDASRGIESSTSKIYMRSTVLVFDLLIYVPSLLYLATRSPLLRHRSLRARHVALLTLLLQPSLILVDNGHFQYNSVMLGFMLQALNFFAEGKDLLGAICFVASLGFKQMALYYSPVVFSYLLGKCLLLGWKSGTKHLIAIGVTTILSFVILFLPFLFPPTSIIAPIQRIFPFARGLFEDKVANFWCASNVFFKWNRHFPTQHLPKMATMFTVIGFMPSMYALLAPGVTAFGVLDATPSTSPSQYHPTSTAEKEKTPASRSAPTFVLFTHALLQCSMAFFLFSFQVHEKTILVPLLPVMLLMVASAPGVDGDWEWGILVGNVACFSMWPLLRRDGMAVPYVALIILWNYMIGHNPFKQASLKLFTIAIYTVIVILHVSELVYTPPARYPDLYPVLNALLGAGVFGMCWLWSIKRLVELSWAMGPLKRTLTVPPSPAIRSKKLSTIGSSNRIPPVIETTEVTDTVINGNAEATPTASSLRKRNPMNRFSLGAIPTGGSNEWSQIRSDSRERVDGGSGPIIDLSEEPR